MVKCEPCNGTGYEICTNPDHGFIDGILGQFGGEHAHGCPLCGWDEQCRILSSKCTECNGTGEA